jgi:hypothetical protein
VLDNRHHLDLAQVYEQFVELVLALTVEDQVGSEDKDSCCHDRQDLQALEADYSIVKQEELVNLKHTTERIENPREGSLQRRNAELVHVEAHFRLVHLQQVLEQLAQTDDALTVTRDVLQLAEVLAVEGPEDEVDIFLRIADVAEGSTVQREVLHRQNAILREKTARLVI